jgi:hypothetical protein
MGDDEGWETGGATQTTIQLGRMCAAQECSQMSWKFVELQSIN